MKRIIASIILILVSGYAAADSLPVIKVRLSDSAKLCPNLDASFPVSITGLGIDAAKSKESFSGYYGASINENSDHLVRNFAPTAERPIYNTFSVFSSDVSCGGMQKSTELGTCSDNLSRQFAKTGENIITVTPVARGNGTYAINCTVRHQ